MYVIVKIQQEYEDIIDVQLLTEDGSTKVFSTKQEAQDFAKETKNNYQIAWNKYVDYIKDFVNNINIPISPDMDSWNKFLDNYPFLYRKTSPKTFKINLESYLFKRQVKIEGFNPPPQVIFYDLHVLELTGKFTWDK